MVHLQACSLCRTLSAQHVQQLSWLPAVQRLAITPRGGPSLQGWRLESCWLPLLCGGCSHAGDRSVCHLSVQRCFSVCHAYPMTFVSSCSTHDRSIAGRALLAWHMHDGSPQTSPCLQRGTAERQVLKQAVLVTQMN